MENEKRPAMILIAQVLCLIMAAVAGFGLVIVPSNVVVCLAFGLWSIEFGRKY